MWRKFLYKTFVLSPLYRFKYPKLELLAISFVAAYFIFQLPEASYFVSNLGALNLLGFFLGGMMFAFGFTTPFAVGFFLSSSPQYIGLAALLGGLGAVIGDMAIFKLIRFSFSDEFESMKRAHIIKAAEHFAEKEFGKRAMVYLSYALAGFLIASPLPDEAGVTLLAGLTTMRAKKLAVISFFFNTLGIYFMLML